MAFRLSKIVLTLCAGLFAALVAWNNVVDYGSNFAFVQHVLAMDTTFPGNQLMGRAVTSPTLHHAAYWAIIAAEAATGSLCLIGTAALWRARRDTAARFRRAKAWAVCGLTLGFVTWFFGFMTVGAEWFLMWQSQTWNGQDSAFRFVACLGLVLVYLAQDDGELTPA